MSTIEELHQRTLSFQKRAPNALPVSPPGGEALESLGGPAGGAGFHHFLPAHQQRAGEVVQRFMELARDHPGDDGLDRVLEEAERLAAEESMDLIRYALLVFITHHPEGRRLPIAPLGERTPALVVPSRPEIAATGLEALGALGDEALLDYFREDTAVNDHHYKWHVVYPGNGVPDPAAPWSRVTKDRQGELFWYMHQQMLARYDSERRAHGLDRVAPLGDYREPIPEGYEANLEGFSNRRPDEVMRDLDGYAVEDHEEYRDRNLRAAEEGFYRVDGGQVPLTPDLAGGTLESTIDSADGGFYGNLHNLGHVLLAYLPDPAGPFADQPGVMISTATAVRDPVFFRWHSHVDDLFFVWQERLPANDFAQGAPPVRLRQGLDGATPENACPDLILCRPADLPGGEAEDFDGEAFGEEAFGGDRWDDDPAASGFTTGELLTMMKEEVIAAPGGDVRKPYLDHEELCYFFRLENLSDEEQRVTVRVFLAAAEVADDRRFWIEMDKFAQRLDPAQRKVVYRSARHSSVVRKPALRPDEPRPVLPPGEADRNYCDCGWPYHLLLPRGTGAGMPFRLLVMLTDWEQDLVGAERKCGSMSFCGARDADYPDSRPMGYPFDRPFSGAGIAQTVAAHDNWATRDLVIRHQAAP